MSDLTTRLGPIELANPVLVASGTFGYGVEAPSLTRASELGGIVTKTLSIEPRRGNPPLRLHETPGGLLNSIGLQNVGVDRFREEKLPKLRALGVPIVASVGGKSVDDFVEGVRRLTGVAGIVAFEINISCPNVQNGMEFSQRPDSAAEVIRQVKKVSKLPVWAKLSPNVTHIGDLARACEDAGADGLTAVNTFVGLAVDLKTRRSVLPFGAGGVSGPAIFPLALAKVREAVRATTIPVVGCGGISDVESALAFLLVGARAIQVGTVSFRDPDAAANIVTGIDDFLADAGISSLDSWIGSFED